MQSTQVIVGEQKDLCQVKEELQIDINNIDNLDSTDDVDLLQIRQRGQRTDRPRNKENIQFTPIDQKKKVKCRRLLEDLLKSMKPLSDMQMEEYSDNYWFFGKHVIERLNSMREEDSICASKEIMKLIS